MSTGAAEARDEVALLSAARVAITEAPARNAWRALPPRAPPLPMLRGATCRCAPPPIAPLRAPVCTCSHPSMPEGDVLAAPMPLRLGLPTTAAREHPERSTNEHPVRPCTAASALPHVFLCGRGVVDWHVQGGEPFVAGAGGGASGAAALCGAAQRLASPQRRHVRPQRPGQAAEQLALRQPGRAPLSRQSLPGRARRVLQRRAGRTFVLGTQGP